MQVWSNYAIFSAVYASKYLIDLHRQRKGSFPISLLKHLCVREFHSLPPWLGGITTPKAMAPHDG